MARILTILGRVGLAARPAPAQPGPEPTGQGRGLSVAGSGPRVALGDLLGLELGLVLEVDVDDVLVLDVLCLTLVLLTVRVGQCLYPHGDHVLCESLL